MVVAKDEEPGELKERDKKYCSVMLGFPLNLKVGTMRINYWRKNGEQKLFCLSQISSKAYYDLVHFR